MYKLKEVKLKEIIDFSKSSTNGSIFTKTLINKNKGCIPVYGASKNEEDIGYGYVKDNLVILNKNKKEIAIKYFENCLTWNIDGSVGIFYRKGRFSLSEKVIPLMVYDDLKPVIDNNYLKFAILNSDEIKNFGFSNKAGKAKLSNIIIKIPIDANGRYDITVQNKIANIYQRIKNRKENLALKQNEIEKINVQLLDNINFCKVKITDLFIPTLGDGKYTKEECIRKRGSYPVYSGNTVEAFEYIDEFCYDGEYLTWSKDGLAGYIMHHNEKFSITNHRGILIPKENVKNINLHYIKLVLEPIFRKNIKGRLGLKEKNEYTTLSKDMIKEIEDKIPIPINEEGEYDLEKQKEIADKIDNVNKIKKRIIEEIENLINMDINIV